MPAPSESFWEDLLLYLEEGSVVPIVGPELVTVRDGDRDVPLQRWLAGRLAETLGLPGGELRDGYGLNDVVALHARLHRPREELHRTICKILRAADLEPPRALGALATVDAFRAIVSLTFDGLLEKALAAARPDVKVTEVRYCPSEVGDLPAPLGALAAPVVFHLLGRCSPSQDYAICDEDVIEFLHAMQEKDRRPKLLFDALRENHLLLLGWSFDDWLTRFFLRVVRGLPFSENRRHREFVVDAAAARAPTLVMFLASYSASTQLVGGIGPAAFVEELARRWQASHPASTAPVPAGGAFPVPDGAVFVSYASEDAVAARALADALRDAGIDVWLDRDRLHEADPWERQLRRAIRCSSVFIPIVSRASLAAENRRRFFWSEWNAASDLATAFSPEERFILPVVVDDASPEDPALPDAFPKKQWARLALGQPTPEFAQRVRELVRDFHRRMRAA